MYHIVIMPKHTPQNELDAVLRAIDQFTEGASVKDISAIMENCHHVGPFSVDWDNL